MNKPAPELESAVPSADADAPANTRKRAEAVQRLQFGLTGLAAMVLLVALANIIQDRARIAQQLSVPEAAPTTEPQAEAVQRDPLADAGIVPDLPAEPTPSPTQQPAIMPEQRGPADNGADSR